MIGKAGQLDRHHTGIGACITAGPCGQEARGSDIFRETGVMAMPLRGEGAGRPMWEWLVSEAAEHPVQL